MAFVHLHNHTEYSLLDGLTHIKDMVRRAAELDMPAVAVTDHASCPAWWELSDACDAVEGDAREAHLRLGGASPPTSRCART